MVQRLGPDSERAELELLQWRKKFSPARLTDHPRSLQMARGQISPIISCSI